MPRTFQEWKRIRESYYEPVDIPYPDKNSVLYKRESNNPYWQRRYENAKSDIHLTALNYTENKVVSLFDSMANIEEDKERALLSKFLPESEMKDTDTLVDQINILMQNRTRYMQTLDRIQDALGRDKAAAPNMSVWFAKYLEPRLIRKMEQFKEEFPTCEDPKRRYIELINQAMVETSTAMANASEFQVGGHTKSVAGGAKDWREINYALKKIPGMWNLFFKNVYKAIGNWDDLYNELTGFWDDNSQHTTAGAIRDLLKLQSRTWSIGGNVVENAMAAVAIKLNQIRGQNGLGNYSVGGGAITAEQNVTTDAMLFFSAESTIDAQDLFNRINKAGNKGYREKLIETTQDLKNNLNTLFGVFINAKNYSIGKLNDSSYSKERHGTFEELPQVFNEMDIQVSNIQDFITTAYNTGDDAIAASMRGEVEESLLQALRLGAAKLMFDDYATIGNMSGGNIIHLYQLDGIYVPSSIVFRSLAQATADQSGFDVDASVKLPDAIDDQGLPDGKGWPGKNNKEIKEYIYDHWQKEFNDAKAACEWRMRFMLNIKKAIQYNPKI